MAPFLEDHMNLELLPNITKYSLWLISAIVIYIYIYIHCNSSHNCLDSFHVYSCMLCIITCFSTLSGPWLHWDPWSHGSVLNRASLLIRSSIISSLSHQHPQCWVIFPSNHNISYTPIIWYIYSNMVISYMLYMVISQQKYTVYLFQWNIPMTIPLHSP